MVFASPIWMGNPPAPEKFHRASNIELRRYVEKRRHIPRIGSHRLTIGGKAAARH